MSMQVIHPFVIELIYKDTSETLKLNSFDMFKTNTIKAERFIIMKNVHGNPIGFKLLELRLTKDSVKFTNWLQHEFKSLFTYDPLLWFASVGTMPKEFRKYLIPFHMEQGI